MTSVLIVDDEQCARKVLAKIIALDDYKVIEAASAAEAMIAFEREHPSAVLLDIHLPDTNGIEIMKQMKALRPEVEVIIVTGQQDIDMAVKAIKLGAYDFIVKPAKIERLTITLKRAVEKTTLAQEVETLSNIVDTQMGQYLGSSTAMKNVVQQMRQVAESDFSVIIQGETGSGKNYFARLIHDHSRRAAHPFVSIDMGAIPDNLAESEIFGFEKGAFTGADRKKPGLFKLADKGTLVIDELQNMSPLMQSKLLKAVEERHFYPLGSTVAVDMDVRIIACTNIDLKKAAQQKKFRSDLFYRMGEFTILLPPLRERSEDIPQLARKFYLDTAEELNKPMREIPDKVSAMLCRYDWPGNVRELKNVIRRATLTATDGVLKPANISFLIDNKLSEEETQPLMPLKQVTAIVVRDAESKAIKQALEQTGGNKTKAAQLLAIDYKTLLTKIKDYSIE
jgi:DNA-binding NtrC family response regulator